MRAAALVLAALLTGCASRPDCYAPLASAGGYLANVITCLAVDKAVDKMKED